MALCLQPVRLTHLTVPFVPHFTISFVHLTSFSIPRVSVSCLNIHTILSHCNSNPAYFFLRNCLPLKLTVPDYCRPNQLLLIVSTAHHHYHTRNLPFPFYRNLYHSTTNRCKKNRAKCTMTVHLLLKHAPI